VPVEAGSRFRAELEQRLRARAPSCAYKVALVAKAMQLSERHLQRLMRASFGVSPRVWLRRQRMGATLELLGDAQSVKAVAIELGYTEVSQFSRDFRGQFGCTPSSVLGEPALLRALAARLVKQT
jgi:AraC-like DNA-binding protein